MKIGEQNKEVRNKIEELKAFMDENLKKEETVADVTEQIQEIIWSVMKSLLSSQPELLINRHLD
mgnify:CR=1 FL=1